MGRIQNLLKGFHLYKGGALLCLFYLFFLKFSMKMRQFGFTETKLFHLHRIFKNGGGGGGGERGDLKQQV